MARLPDWLKFWQRQKRGPEAEEIKALTDQFRVTLLAAVRKIEGASPGSPVLEPIKKLLLKEDWRWKDAYEVEQQLVLLYDSETLETELSRRILESKHVLYSDTAAWFDEQLKTAESLDEKRALLLRLVNDLQWRYTVNEAKLGYTKQITGRTGVIFILAVLVFIGFLLVVFVGTSFYGATAQPPSDPQSTVEWWWWHSVRFRTFLLAAVAGYLGAAFSMVAGLKTRLETSGINQMKNASSMPMLLSRVLVGTGAAMILYFFFESKLLGGEAFPKLETIVGFTASTQQNGTVVQQALLVVWCFIAGFSEKLVPGLLARTEARVTEEGQSAPHGPPAAASPKPVPAEPRGVLPAEAGAPAAAAPEDAGGADEESERPGTEPDVEVPSPEEPKNGSHDDPPAAAETEKSEDRTRP